MANQVEWIDGFDEYQASDLALRYTSVGSVSINTASPVVEGRYVGMSNNQRMNAVVPADPTYTIGCHIQPQGGGSANTDIFLLQESGTNHVTVKVNFTTGLITIQRDTTTVGTPTAVAPFLPGVWRWFEVQVKVHDTTGTYEVRVDGVTVMSASGLDTRNGGAVGTINTIRIGCGLSQESVFMDNLYLASGSAGFQGEGRCVTDVATADGGLTDFAASTGNRWACVDEIPQNGDTDYISSSTSGHRSTFTMATFGLTGTIKALALSIFGRKDDAAARTLQAMLRRSGSNQDHADTWALSTSTAKYESIWNTDPFTASAWADSNIDSTEYGIENV
jgi:hypothetical protein